MFESIFRLITKVIQSIFWLLIRFYQLFISPVLGPRCRFYPTCSEYALQAVRQYPLFKALWLIIKRLLRCRPFGKWGYDPLPQPDKRTPSE